MSRLLIPHLARAVPWWPLAAAVPLAILAQVRVLADDPPALAVLAGLWLAAGVLGAGAGFALPDLMASTVVTPVPRWVRQWLRTTLVLAPAAAVWASLYLAVRRAAAPELTWPDGIVVVQSAVCGLLPLAAAAVGSRFRDTATGALLGPLVQGVALVASLTVPAKSSPWSSPTSGEWSAAQGAWPAALVLVLLTLSLANRERT